jgi:hypothetical protein
MAQQPQVGQGLLNTEASRSQSDTSRSVGLLWTSDEPNVETSTWQNTTHTRDIHPCHRWNSNPQSQQASGRRPTPQTASPLRSALFLLQAKLKNSHCKYRKLTMWPILVIKKSAEIPTTVFGIASSEPKSNSVRNGWKAPVTPNSLATFGLRT